MTKIAIIGCGFWAHYQVAAWLELPVEVIAVCDPDESKAKMLADKFGISTYYTDAKQLFALEKPDLVDIITNPESHAALVLLAADHGIPVICQKPMAADWATATMMVDYCASKNVPFYIHENFRWQAAMLKVKQILDAGIIGQSFKARIYFNSSFPVLKYQPTLALLPQMIIADLGVHLFDLIRFFFGEAKLLFCRTQKIGTGFKGENVANTFIETMSGVHCYVELSWASVVEYESFPQTLLYIEGTQGSIRLDKDYKLFVIKPDDITEDIVPIVDYPWLHPEYKASQAALVACNQDLLDAIVGKKESDNRADLNLKTLRLVYAAYESAIRGEVMDI
ncbi:MAG: Gfo/Idh/MocA family oxidoreductase [Saprospiraceae bacterium]|nr:Gfo/Idh/MocA family oxidoreductase [Saprospiraceae bacterium]